MYQFDTPYNRKGTNCTKWDIFTDEEMLPMWIADMDFEAPAPIYEAFEKRAAHHVYAYSRLSNEYYQAVIDWMQRRHQFHVEKDWIVFTPGVVVALTLGVQAVTEPGEEVMILSPVYGPFRGATTACGRKLIESPLVNNDGYYTIDFEDMEKRVTPNTKAFMLCSPHNPVGRVWTREELEGIANFCLKHNLYLIADEIHNDLIFKDHIVMNNISEQLADRTILCTAPSKTFNLAGAGIAAIIAAGPKVRAKIDRAINDNECCDVNVFGVAADIAAWNQGEEWLEALLSYLQGNLAAAQAFFAEKLPLCRLSKLEGTYLLWADMRPMLGADLDTDAFCESLKTHEKVWAAAGSHYGRDGEGFVRINIATQRALLLEGLTRLAAGAERWQNREIE